MLPVTPVPPVRGGGAAARLLPGCQAGMEWPSCHTQRGGTPDPQLWLRPWNGDIMWRTMRNGPQRTWLGTQNMLPFSGPEVFPRRRKLRAYILHVEGFPPPERRSLEKMLPRNRLGADKGEKSYRVFLGPVSPLGLDIAYDPIVTPNRILYCISYFLDYKTKVWQRCQLVQRPEWGSDGGLSHSKYNSN